MLSYVGLPLNMLCCVMNAQNSGIRIHKLEGCSAMWIAAELPSLKEPVVL